MGLTKYGEFKNSLNNLENSLKETLKLQKNDITNTRIQDIFDRLQEIDRDIQEFKWIKESESAAARAWIKKMRATLQKVVDLSAEYESKFEFHIDPCSDPDDLPVGAHVKGGRGCSACQKYEVHNYFYGWRIGFSELTLSNINGELVFTAGSEKGINLFEFHSNLVRSDDGDFIKFSTEAQKDARGLSNGFNGYFPEIPDARDPNHSNDPNYLNPNYPKRTTPLWIGGTLTVKFCGDIYSVITNIVV